MGRTLLIGVALLAVGAAATRARAQTSPYVEPDSWEAEWTERLVAAGALPSLPPLSRPVTEQEVLDALRAVDTLRLSAVERHWYRGLSGELVARTAKRAARWELAVGVEPGVRAGDAPLLDPFVVEGSRGIYPATSVFGAARWGPVFIVVAGEYVRREVAERPVGDRGESEFRSPSAYLRIEHRWGDVALGLVPWELGPRAPQVLVMGRRPEPLPALAWSVGVRRIRFRQYVSKLDRIDGERRYFALHRLELQPASRIDVGLTETVLWSGKNRGWELNELNPLAVYFAEEANGSPSNVSYALDVVLRPHSRVELYGELLIDDLTWAENWPHRWGGLAGGRASGVVPGFSIEAHYALASALLYQTTRRSELYLYEGLGIGANRADFERVTVQLHWDATPEFRLSPVYDRLYQGLRDPRMAIVPGQTPAQFQRTLSDPAYMTHRFGLEGFARLGASFTARFGGAYLDTDVRREEAAGRAGRRVRGWVELRYGWRASR